MARTVRDANLGTRDARLDPKRIKAGRRYWRGIHEGLALGYRRGRQGSGSWIVRMKKANGEYGYKVFAAADDHASANNATVLNFAQAQRRAIELESEALRNDGVIIRPLTVGEAAEHYLKWFRANKKSIAETEHVIYAHILPTLGKKEVAGLKARTIGAWHEKLAAQPARVRTPRFGAQQRYRPEPKTDEQKRARKATANRILTVLKAILNKAFEGDLVADNTEWRKVKPFENADSSRIRFLSDAEAIRLVNACPLDLRSLVRGALLTGARYKELTGIRVQDVNLETAQVYISPSKSGSARHVPLNAEGLALFRNLIAGKTGDELVMRKADGTAWGKNHHVRPLLAACKAAKVRPAVAFHELRHTYASHLANAGADLLTISKLLGHADTRITSKHYAHLTDKTLAAAVAKLPDFGSESISNVQAIR